MFHLFHLDLKAAFLSLGGVLLSVRSGGVVFLLELGPHLRLVVNQVLDHHFGTFLLFLGAGLAFVLQGVGQKSCNEQKRKRVV